MAENKRRSALYAQDNAELVVLYVLIMLLGGTWAAETLSCSHSLYIRCSSLTFSALWHIIRATVRVRFLCAATTAAFLCVWWNLRLFKHQLCIQICPFLCFFFFCHLTSLPLCIFPGDAKYESFSVVFFASFLSHGFCFTLIVGNLCVCVCAQKRNVSACLMAWQPQHTHIVHCVQFYGRPL